MSAPLFSVIIPTFERQAFLDEAVESVLAQSVANLEALVVDDGGRIAAVIPSDARVRLLRHDQNLGISSARNTGIVAATGRFIAFLDDDDVWLPDRLALALRALERAPIALCWSSFSADRVSGRVLEGLVPGDLLAGMTPSLGATSVARELIEPFDSSYAASEDVEWWVRMARHPVATEPELGCLIRRHPGPRVSHGASARAIGGRRVLEEHAAFFDAHRPAAAFRWKRVGLQHLAAGERALAAGAFARSIRLRPEPRTFWHLARCVPTPNRPRRPSSTSH